MSSLSPIQSKSIRAVADASISHPVVLFSLAAGLPLLLAGRLWILGLLLLMLGAGMALLRFRDRRLAKQVSVHLQRTRDAAAAAELRQAAGRICCERTSAAVLAAATTLERLTLHRDTSGVLGVWDGDLARVGEQCLELTHRRLRLQAFCDQSGVQRAASEARALERTLDQVADAAERSILRQALEGKRQVLTHQSRACETQARIDAQILAIEATLASLLSSALWQRTLRETAGAGPDTHSSAELNRLQQTLRDLDASTEETLKLWSGA